MERNNTNSSSLSFETTCITVGIVLGSVIGLVLGIYWFEMGLSLLFCTAAGLILGAAVSALFSKHEDKTK